MSWRFLYQSHVEPLLLIVSGGATPPALLPSWHQPLQTPPAVRTTMPASLLGLQAFDPVRALLIGVDELMAGWMPPVSTPPPGPRHISAYLIPSQPFDPVRSSLISNNELVSGWMPRMATPPDGPRHIAAHLIPAQSSDPIGEIGAGVVVSWTSYGGLYEHRDALYAGLTPTFEVCMRQTTGTVYARLYDTTIGGPVAGSEVTTSSGTFVLVESIAMVLIDGNVYQAQFGAQAGDAGEFYSASVVYTP